MKLLHTYLLRRLLLTLMVSMFSLTALVVLFKFVRLSQLARDKGFDLSVVINSLHYLAPSGLSMTLPIALVIAVVITFGALGDQNEFAATKAAGVSPYWLVCPVIVVGVIVSGLTLYLSDEINSRCLVKLRQEILQSVESNLKKNAQPGRTLSMTLHNGTGIRLSFLPQSGSKDKGAKLDSPIAVAIFDEEDPVTTLYAAHHEIAFVRVLQPQQADPKATHGRPPASSVAGREGKTRTNLVLTLFRGERIGKDPRHVLFFDRLRMTYVVPSDLAARVSIGNNPTTQSIAWNLRKQRECLARSEVLRGKLSEVLAMKKFDPKWKKKRLIDLNFNMDELRNRGNESIAEVHRRMSAAFAALALVLIGMPIGLRFGGGGPIKCTLLALIIVAVPFYPPLMLLRSLAEEGKAAPLVLWVPTAFVAIVGAILLDRQFKQT
jgi:lipopolysaccharide export LptBFGC system permease protein LptF